MFGRHDGFLSRLLIRLEPLVVTERAGGNDGQSRIIHPAECKCLQSVVGETLLVLARERTEWKGLLQAPRHREHQFSHQVNGSRQVRDAGYLCLGRGRSSHS
jgi:hypothetical protein